MSKKDFNLWYEQSTRSIIYACEKTKYTVIMKKSIILSTQQIKHLQEHGTITTVDMVKPQPETDKHKLHTVLDTTGDSKDIGKHFWAKVVDFSVTERSELFSAPYQPRQQVYVREMWAINENIPKSINVHSYFADWDSNWIIGGMIWPDEIGILETDEAWQSAVTMPRHLSRYTLECTEVQSVKVRDVTEDTIHDKLKFNKKWFYDQNISTGESSGIPDWQLKEAFMRYIISKYGQGVWDNNEYIFITTFKLVKTR